MYCKKKKTFSKMFRRCYKKKYSNTKLPYWRVPVKQMISTHWNPDDIFKCSFLRAKFCVLIKISVTFVVKSLTDSESALVHILA